MRGAALSISNNIAEGSGSTSDRDFRRFLDIARRSVFEDANMVTVFCRHGLISSAQRDGLLVALQEEARMLTGFMASLRRRIAARSLALCAFSITIALVVARLLQGV